ncbi:MAG: hydroxymethylpyrimidine/phosphomethylpyrimidine kinase [Planctomycetes bacterium]|nr:hydroxymethylpyrimidine/phosphomethylpyrimidine kinase [Planctomycetota bacterium]
MSGAVLVLAGSDPLGYSGLQADLRHLAHAGVSAYGVPTALTLQALDRVESVEAVPAVALHQALQLALADGEIGAVKIGMLPGVAQIGACVEGLAALRAPVVLDPVLAATSGVVFLDDDGLVALRTRLLPRVSLLTPNMPELQRLSGMPVSTREEQIAAMRSLRVSAVLLKGGHAEGTVVEDLLLHAETLTVFSGPRLQGTLPRGTGCMLSTLIAARLAGGSSMPEAVGQARAVVLQAIAQALRAGSRRLAP